MLQKRFIIPILITLLDFLCTLIALIGVMSLLSIAMMDFSHGGVWKQMNGTRVLDVIIWITGIAVFIIMFRYHRIKQDISDGTIQRIPDKLTYLQEKLKEAIATENYEKAKEYTERIAKLTKK